MTPNEENTAASPAILNHPSRRLAGPELLHQLVSCPTKRRTVAVDHLSSDRSRLSLSYGELHRQSDSLAASISAVLGPSLSNNSFVIPVLVPQGPALYVTLLAILKAGGAFCPLNLDAPHERVKFIFEDVSARVVVCTSDLVSRVSWDHSSVHVLVVDNLVSANSKDTSLEKPSWSRNAKPSDLAYVMYTSGSTGTPKGVGVSHTAATQSLLAHDRHMPAFSRFLQFAAPTFDVSVFETFFPLFRGSTLVSCDRATMLNDLPSVLREMGVDACELTPTVAGNLLRKRENAPGLRLLLTIGEMLTMPIIEEFGGSEQRPSILWAMYGPTEAAIHCTLQPAFSRSSAVGNIGVPLDTVSVFVLRADKEYQDDKSPEVLSMGEVGELAIGGYQLADGYFNRPEQTTAAFIQSPYGLIYRTGDKARILQDGTIDCLGRISDGQVKLRGQRIELGEIEQAAMRNSLCRGATAAVVGSILVLFCVADSVDGTDSEIRQTCGVWLPAFMVPGDIVVLADFPRLPSGKVDRKGLISSYRELLDHPPKEIDHLGDDLERKMCRVASEVLDSSVGPSTNLPAAGLDSLVAIKLSGAFRRAGYPVSVEEILGFKTISQLHTATNSRRTDTSTQTPDLTQEIPIAVDKALLQEEPGLEPYFDDIECVLPCNALQESMLAETLINPQAYCNWIEITIPGDISTSTFIFWFHRMAELNEVLRSGFCHCGTHFVQIVWKQLEMKQLAAVDLLAPEYCLRSETDLLRPLRVQLAPSRNEERRVLLQIHHALYDGWTIDLLLKDFNKLFRQEDLAPRPQFKEVIVYSRSSDYLEKCNIARAFWAEALHAYQPSPFPILVGDYADSRLTASRNATFDIDPSRVKKAFALFEYGAQTLFQAALMFVWGLVLGTEDVVIGTVTSGRTLPIPQIEDVMGPCIAPVPLRVNFAQMKDIRDLLATIHAANRSSLSHSVLPLSEIRKACGMLPGQSMYDVLFAYQESLYSHDRQERRIRETGHQDYLETQIVVEIEPQDAMFSCRLTYHVDFLSEQHSAVLIEQLREVSRHFLLHLDEELSSTKLALPKGLTSTYNTKPKLFSGTPDLASAVERVARDHPEKAAVCFANAISEDHTDVVTITFQQLNNLGNQIARYLRDHGARVGHPVAIIFEKSVLLYAGILGIVKSGCSYLPLLPTTPISRIEAILGQASAPLCLGDTDLCRQLKHLTSCTMINLDERPFTGYSDSPPSLPPDPTRLANIIYTSGSTGTPKGVCVTQRNIISNLDILSRIYPVDEGSRLLQSCSQAFDVSVFEIFFAWTQGMCLCSATNDTLFEDLERSIRKLQVTHLSMTPTVASLIDPAKVPEVRFLVASGEPMTESVARKWEGRLYQGYGPSETTNICTAKKMRASSVIKHLGWTFENTSAFVFYVDSADAVPLGCVGELCFGGDQVVQGYLEMPELTLAKFIHHPQYGRLYRSGDLGRMLPDGSLVIVGRTDDQIKLRGQRIELNEITTTIKELGEVSDCVSLLAGRRGSPSDQLVSFYTMNASAGDAKQPETLTFDDELTATNSRLFRHLSSTLPVYMVPSYIVPVSRLPFTAAGKLDKARLVETFIGLAQPYLESAAAPLPEIMHDGGSWSEAESKVAADICSILSLPPDSLQRWTPLPAVGLDSLSAIGLTKLLRKRFNRRVTVSAILHSSCVALLAKALENLPMTNHSEATDATTPFSLLKIPEEEIRQRLQDEGKTVKEILPCTSLQESMLAISTGGRSYLNRSLFRLGVNPEIVQRAWEQMCQRHSILRTCFISTKSVENPIVQVVLGNWSPQWHHIDDTAETVDSCVAHHVRTVAEAIDSFEPPVSFATIKHNEKTYLSFICHHALYDAVAIERLLFEVEELIDGHLLPPAPSFVPFLQETLTPSPSSEAFWTHHLAGLEPPSLPKPTDSITLDGGYGTWSGPLIASPLTQLHKTSREIGISLLSVCQAAWASVLGAVIDTGDVCFGNVVSGRTVLVDGVTELVAPCFNTVPVRINLGQTERNIDLLKRFQELNPKILEHQFTPLRSLLRSHAPQKDRRRLFDTILLLQQPSRPLNKDVWTLERDDGEMDVPLVCEVIPDTVRDRLDVKLHYERDWISDPMVTVIYYLFSYAVDSCLHFPASQVPIRCNLPSNLQSKILDLKLEPFIPSSPGSKAHRGLIEEMWDERELTVRSVLSKLSSVPETSIRQSTTIYQLGLDSISAVQIASLLREEGFSVSASDVVSFNTCQALALHLSEAATPNPSSSYEISGFQERVYPLLNSFGITGGTIEKILPCVPLQSGMLSQFLQSPDHDYFNYLAIRFESSRLDEEWLRQAWSTVLHHHSILRTGFIATQDKDLPFAMVQYRYESQESELPLAIDSDGTTSFDIAKWRRDTAADCKERIYLPPWRVACVNRDGGFMIHLAIHHALYDAQSIRRVLDDLSRCCHQVPMPAVSPAEVVVMDILSRTQSDIGRHEEFWAGQADRLVVNKFPILTPLREESRAIVVETARSMLPLEQIKSSLRDSGFSMQTAIQAAWARVLSSYLGESAVAFGVVLSGRNREATRDAVFPCITTLPVIAQNCSSNREMLQLMQRTSIDLYKQQHIPLAQIQRWLGRPASRLFDTLLVYQKFDRSSDFESPWEIVDDCATVDYPVSVEVEPRDDDRLEYRLTFFSDVLPKRQAELLLRQFDAALSALATSPDAAEDELFTDQPELFSVSPALDPNIPSEERFLHEFVEFQARRIPDKVALRFVSRFDNVNPVSRTWSYRELDENGNRTAHMLKTLVQTGDIVAIHFDKCPEVFFAILGILKAGCAFVALDPNAPAARKQFILRDSKASVLLTSSGRKDEDMSWCPAGTPMLQVDEEMLRSLSCEPVSHGLVPSDVCYCLYTSGTTGTPKGCEITHENAVQAMLAFQRLFAGHWDESSNWLQFASFHFDVAVLEQYWSWSVGITLVAAPRDLILGDLAGTISKLGITHIDLTPSLARLIGPDEVPSLCRGVFITGGEQLRQEILDRWGSKGVIFNAYGPTEATIGVTTFPRVPKNGRSSNIGRQFDNVGSYVLKPGTDTPVLRGAVGELCLSGKLVGKGYLNRDDLTSEKFPTLDRFGQRVYRTGDLVRILHNGCFDFLGRADDQVKLRGQRLEIGEINHTIKTGTEGVADVVTLVIRNEKQEKDLLVSFIVANGGLQRSGAPITVITGPEATRLGKLVRKSCREALPGYMVPTYVLQLNHIPLSSNNKAEVKELKKLFNSLGPTELLTFGAAAVQPDILGVPERRLHATEERIVGVLTTMGAVDESRIAPSTSVFDLGIDSISAMQFSKLLKQAGFSTASPAVILKNPQLSDLSDALLSGRSLTRPGSVSAARQLIQAWDHKLRAHVMGELGVGSSDIEYIAPCSPLQESMVSRSRMPGTRGAYFNTFRFELLMTASPTQLHAAWQNVFNAYPILRTVFISTADGPVQVALKSPSLLWTERAITANETLEDILVNHRKHWINSNNNDIQRPLDFLLVNTQEKSLLVMHIFHGLYDATSFDLLIRRVIDEYNHMERMTYEPTFLEGLIHGPMKSFVWCKDFWTDHLLKLSHKPFPRLSNNPSSGPISVERVIPFDGLAQVRTKLGVGHQAIVQAIWVSIVNTIAPRSGSVGIVTSGRSIDLDDSESIVGPLINTIPFGIRVAHDETWSSLIRRCHDFNIAILPFQHVPLKTIQQWCSDGKPLFDTLFSFQREGSSPTDEERIWAKLESADNPDFPLAFEASLTERGSLKLLLVSQSEIADLDVLSNLLDRVEDAVQSIVDNPDGAVTRGGTTIPNHSSGASEVIEANVMNTENGEPDFEWTPMSLMIREQIALLAQVSPDSIGPTTSLLELGLDSIDAIKLSSRLRQAGLDVFTSQLLGNQTVYSLVRKLRHQSHTNGHAHDIPNGLLETPALPSPVSHSWLDCIGSNLKGVESVFPTTPLQDSLVAEMIQSGFHHYFNHDVLELGPEVNVETLKNSLKTVIKHSPILRTSFIPVNNPDVDIAYCQVVNETIPGEIEEVQIGGAPELSQITEGARLRAEAAGGASSLFQLALATAGSHRYLILSIAHALYDGWSLGLLHQDFQKAYQGSYSARDSYGPYLAKITASSKSPDARHFWSGFLDGATSALIPEKYTTQTGPTAGTVTRAERSSSIPLSQIRQSCKKLAISPHALGQACWAALLAHRARALDITFGVVLSGRDSEAAEGLMFPVMNTVAVRSILYGDVRTWLQYMQENLTNISRFQHFPLRRAQRFAQNPAVPLFNSLFIYQRRPDETIEEDNPLMRSVDGAAAVDYPVSVEMEIRRGELVWLVACSSDYITEDDATLVLRQLDAILKFLIESPTSNILDFDDMGRISICGLSPVVFDSQKRDEGDTAKLPANVEPIEVEDDWSDTERRIMLVLAELSAIPASSIRRGHSVYHLGLDSISSIKASSLLRNKEGIVLTPRQLLGAESLIDLARLASPTHPAPHATTNGVINGDNNLAPSLQGVDVHAALQAVGIEESSLVEDILPATPMQVHMLSVWQNTSGAVFFPTFTYRLSGIKPGNAETLISAWQSLTKETPILRTSFVSTTSRELPFLQLIHYPESNLCRIVIDGKQRSGLTELSCLPLVSLHASSQEGNHWELKLSIHHALYDGVSLPLILQRFGELCRNHNRVRQNSYGATWRRFLWLLTDTSERNQRKAFWEEYLDGAKTTFFSSTLAPSPMEAGKHIITRTSCVARPALRNVSDISSVCREQGVSLQSLFIAACAKFLASRNDGDDVVLGVYVAGRHIEADMDQLPFPTLSLLPLRVRKAFDTDLVTIASRVQQDVNLLSANSHQLVGLWEIKDWTGITVNCFVNFLSLPSSATGKAPEDPQFSLQEPEAIVQENSGSEATTERVNGVDAQSTTGPSISSNPVRDVFPDAIDIEASIRNSALDIGVFGPAILVGAEGAEALVSQLVDILDGVHRDQYLDGKRPMIE